MLGFLIGQKQGKKKKRILPKIQNCLQHEVVPISVSCEYNSHVKKLVNLKIINCSFPK